MSSELNSADSIMDPELSQETNNDDMVLSSTGQGNANNQSVGTGFQSSDGNFSGAVDEMDERNAIWQPATTQGKLVRHNLPYQNKLLHAFIIIFKLDC